MRKRDWDMGQNSDWLLVSPGAPCWTDQALGSLTISSSLLYRVGSWGCRSTGTATSTELLPTACPSIPSGAWTTRTLPTLSHLGTTSGNLLGREPDVPTAQSAVGTVFRAAPSPLTVVGSPWSFSAAVKLTLRFSLLL